jgi:hypothetical protein
MPVRVRLSDGLGTGIFGCDATVFRAFTDACQTLQLTWHEHALPRLRDLLVLR